MKSDDPRHGTNAGHRAHFADSTTPCQPCRDAHAKYRRNLWRKKYVRRVDTLYVPSAGVTRRIRALQAIGWRMADIDEALGHLARSNYVHNLTRQEQVHRDTAEKVDAVYRRLCMKPGPSERSRRFAIARGWPPPLAWTNIDDLSETPHGWQYAAPDRGQILAELDEQGAGIAIACRTLEVSRRALEKWCGRNGHAAVYQRLVARDSTNYWRNQFTEGGVA